MPTRSAPRAAALAACLLCAAGAAWAARPASPARPAAAASAADLERIERELAAAARTRELVAEKLTAREADLRARVRVLYKLTRAGLAPLWLDEQARAELTRRRAAARRLILRDLEERQLLREELARAEAQEARLAAERDAQAQAAPMPAGFTLALPVRGRVALRFGVRVDRATRARLASRGLELAARAGQPVTSPLAATVLYAGPVSGLGQGVILDAGGDLLVVVAGLSGLEVDAGQSLAAGQRLGAAAGSRVRLELRRGGRPVDPTPFLAR